MKRSALILLFVFSFLISLAQDVLPRPNPPRLVTDEAGVLSAEEKATLESKLVALDDNSSNQIAVVLIKTTGDYAIEDYATKLFREWGIGNKKTNNGVLIIAAIDDRKVKIEVGYGLEGAIPDIAASEIYRNDIVPAFREQHYYEGIDKAVDDLAKAAVGEYKVASKKKNKGGSPAGGIFTFIIILFIVIMLVGRSGRGGGGGRGGGLGGIAEAVILSSLLNGGRGSSSGGWGGGSGGGGFGGFGGGSSGGGGAGGSW
jgi:uncharacterized protein